MRKQAGFTLLEVMVALLIVALTIVPILTSNADLIAKAERTRTQRDAWVLLTEKMGELQMDKSIAMGETTSGAGDFSDKGTEYENFRWEYDTERIPVNTQDPDNVGELPKEINRMTLKISWRMDNGKDAVVSITMHIPTPEEEAAGEAEGEGGSGS